MSERLNKNRIIPVAAAAFAALACVIFGLKTFLVLAIILIGVFLVATKYETATYILCLYLFIDYVARNYIGGTLGAYWDELFFVMMLALWVYKWIVNGKDSIRTTPLDGWLILFYGACLVVLFANSIDFSQSVEGLRAAVQHTFWFFVVSQLIKSKENGRNILRVLVLVAAIVGLHGIYQYIVGVPMPANWIDSMEAGLRTRAFSIIGSPNILGSLMVLVAPISFALFFAEKNAFNKLVYLGVTGIMALCLIFTFSRGAWIGFGIAMGLYIIIKDKRLIIPAVILVLLAVIFVPSIVGRLTYMLSPEYIESSLRAGRLVRWIEGINIVRIRPFMGMGHGAFGGAVAVNNEVKDVFYMDNYFLKTAVEMGLLGFITFFALMYNVLAWSFRAAVNVSDKYYKELCLGGFAGLMGVVVHNVVENVFEVPMMVAYFWVIAAVIMYFYKNINKDTPNSNL